MSLFPPWRRDPPPVTTESDDAELIAAIAAESMTALRILHRRHAPWLRARLARRCADLDAVDDALQDTFMAVWRSAARFSPTGGDAAGWLWTIAMRRLVSVLRGRGARWIGQGHDLDEARSTVESAEDLVLVRVEHGDLDAAIRRLTPELRAVIQATVLDGLTVREAAHLLGVPEGTVKTRAMRARARLRRDLA
ncbi:RNA polymerase sigma factor [Streptosporangium vulgare]|uniref:RNA polymerase sigma factor n=1 Tax=Streptosporangium vulgare TaxID=46190 RepID=A0ABV5TKS8_9ACTN